MYWRKCLRRIAYFHRENFSINWLLFKYRYDGVYLQVYQILNLFFFTIVVILHEFLFLDSISYFYVLIFANPVGVQFRKAKLMYF